MTGLKDNCWLWAGYTNPSDYGKVGSKYAHRLVYEALVGEIPDGYHIDHLCMVRRCVNPNHLEAVTQAENNRRGLLYGSINKWQRDKTHCKNGHEFNEANTYHFKGNRQCRPCNNINSRAYRKKVREHVIT